MSNGESAWSNSLQKRLMLSVNNFRLFPRPRQCGANPLAGTDATPPGFAGKKQIGLKFAIGSQTESVHRPSRHDFRVSAPPRSVRPGIVLRKKFFSLTGDGIALPNPSQGAYQEQSIHTQKPRDLRLHALHIEIAPAHAGGDDIEGVVQKPCLFSGGHFKRDFDLLLSSGLLPGPDLFF
jgi:hypothetical protein